MTRWARTSAEWTDSMKSIASNDRNQAIGPLPATAVQIFFAERSLDAATLQMAFGDHSTECCGAYGEASACVALDSLLDGESEIAVGGGRDLSRHVVGS